MAADEARSIGDFGKQRQLAEATIAPYEVYQSVTGEAGVYDKSTSTSSGNYFELTTRGRFNVAKTAGIVFLKGARVYWDHSANAAHYKKVNDRDFYIGRATELASSGNNIVIVDLNINPPDDIDLFRDGYLTVPIGTQALGGFLPPQWRGGSLFMELTATNEAQKVDALSVNGFLAGVTGAKAIVELAFRVPNDGAGTVTDVSIGIASATHATDFDAVAESLLVHLNANDVNIYLESDDGVSVEIAATDSTIDYTEGSAVAQRVEVWFDMADPADVQCYINGSLVLGATVFDVNAGAGPWFLVAHIEKTASTEVYQFSLDWLRVRFAEQ